MQRLLFLVSSALAVSACVTVPNTKVCSVAGVISAGGICAETLTSRTSDLTMDEFLDFLEAQPERPDPKDPSKKLPAHGAAVCQSSEDWNKQKTALEQACRELGKRCSYEIRRALAAIEVKP
jgi:hypothetical protein